MLSTSVLYYVFSGLVLLSSLMISTQGWTLAMQALKHSFKLGKTSSPGDPLEGENEMDGGVSKDARICELKVSSWMPVPPLRQTA